MFLVRFIYFILSDLHLTFSSHVMAQFCEDMKHLFVGVMYMHNYVAT